MDEDYGRTYGIDKLAELLIERGIEFCVEDGTSLLFMDGSGSPHECWMAGAEENLVNVMIVVTPEQAVSVPDLNGVINENEKLRIALKALIKGTHHELCDGRVSHECEECSMNHSKGGCIMTDVMDFFNDDEMCELLMADNQREEEL